LEDLRVEFATPDGMVKAVNGVSLSMKRGTTLAITGESGAGKTSLGLAILNLLPPAGRIVDGRIHFRDMDILSLSKEELRRVRGRQIAMIFQDATTSLNPILSIGEQVEEIITTHLDVPRREVKTRTLDLLAQVGLPDPEEVVKRYPMHLSGGMAQRVMIAIATALNPDLLIADEPTSALDVTVQAAILDELTQLQRRHGTSILLITHDLGVVAQMADEVAVMYAGSIVERAAVTTLFERPRHPYTWALLASRPRWDLEPRQHPLPVIRGASPNLTQLPRECVYLPRCPKATNVCRLEPAPPLEERERDHPVACYNPISHDSDAGSASGWADD
jgi:oligopeptide/dipeptide ABC transporter ATP-binding protein